MSPKPDADAPGKSMSEAKPTNASPFSQDQRRPTVYLHPGQLLVSTEAVSILTILGSCVALCVWDSAARIGGMAHFVLPVGSDTGSSALRFGNVAIRKLLDDTIEAGAAPERMRAKIFGGASVLSSYRGRHGRLGEKNAAVARETLLELGLPSAVEDIGGQRGRKLIFHTDTGDAWVKAI